MQIECILVIEDQEDTSAFLTHLVTKLGYIVHAVPTLATARTAIKSQPWDLILSDVHLPDGSSLELVKELVSERQPPLIIMMSGQATLESAIEAMRLGAADYLVKPIMAGQMEVALGRLEKWKRITTENSYFRDMEAFPEM